MSGKQGQDRGCHQEVVESENHERTTDRYSTTNGLYQKSGGCNSVSTKNDDDGQPPNIRAGNGRRSHQESPRTEDDSVHKSLFMSTLQKSSQTTQMNKIPFDYTRLARPDYTVRCAS